MVICNFIFIFFYRSSQPLSTPAIRPTIQEIDISSHPFPHLFPFHKIRKYTFHFPIPSYYHMIQHTRIHVW